MLIPRLTFRKQVLTKQDILIISQARMTSSRLPGKVMMRAAGRPLLDYHLCRLGKVGVKVLLAITTNPQDDVLEDYCLKHDVAFFRGSEEDVLSRFAQAVKDNFYRIIIRVTSDCPLIDHNLISDAIDQYLQWNDERIYHSNCFPRTYSRGFDFEIFSAETLLFADAHATDTFDREHVTPFIWNNKSGAVIIKNYAQKMDYSAFRLCVDTVEDFELMRILIEKYGAHQMLYRDIESLLEQHPELVAINAGIEQKKV